MRILFLVSYGLSRVAMMFINGIQWQDTYILFQENKYSPMELFFFVFETIMTSGTVIFNFHFLRKQYFNYLKHFSRKKKE